MLSHSDKCLLLNASSCRCDSHSALTSAPRSSVAVGLLQYRAFCFLHSCKFGEAASRDIMIQKTAEITDLPLCATSMLLGSSLGGHGTMWPFVPAIRGLSIDPSDESPAPDTPHARVLDSDISDRKRHCSL